MLTISKHIPLPIRPQRIRVDPINQLKWGMPIVHCHLRDDKYTSKCYVMLEHIMTELVSQYIEVLQTPVDSLMPASSNTHGLLVVLALTLIWSAALGISAISFISQHLFTWSEHLPQQPTEDSNIRTSLGRKGTIEVNNITSFNANS